MSRQFEELLENYAELSVRVGLNLRPGQRLLLRAPVQAAQLVRPIVAKAYQAGARLVDVIWSDDQINLSRFQFAPRDSFEEFPVWKTKVLEDHAESGDALLSIYAEDPDLLKDQDPELVTLVQRTAYKHSQAYLNHLSRNSTNWCVISMPIPSWADKVFPGLPGEEQEQKLWDAIFEVCRVKEDDPVAAWTAHNEQLVSRSEYLNRKQYAALKFVGPGTNLTLGLPPGHIWISGRITAGNGIPFTANLPTEEIFTLPHRDRAEGVVSATRPLSYAGTLIEDFSLTFERGNVTKVSAAKGEEILRKLVETDEGAARLGEVALLPHSSPISRSGLLFYNSLFDENAASHLALGKAYQFTLEDGATLSTEDFAARGGNTSLVHVDFMAGSDKIDVDGIGPDDSTEAIMRSGEWAFEV